MTEQSSSQTFKIEEIRQGLVKATPSRKKRAFEKFALAALGSIPWVGSFISAAASIELEKEEIERDSLQSQWLEEHQSKLEKLHETLEYVVSRLESLGEEINQRIESPEFLDIVRKGFRVWDKSDTDEKRKYVADLIANASGTSIASDDVVRLFVEWLDKYHEIHLHVIKALFNNPGATRGDIWRIVYGDKVQREDSAEADLFKMIFHDLSTGHILRQERAKTAGGDFIKRRPIKTTRASSPYMEYAFEDTKPYELTDLGSKFVHYALNDVIPRIE